jgi:hypothetical protein
LLLESTNSFFVHPFSAVIPLLSEADHVRNLLKDSIFPSSGVHVDAMAEMIIERLGSVGCKTALRLTELAVATVERANPLNEMDLGTAQLDALSMILDDLAGDEATSDKLCEVF